MFNKLLKSTILGVGIFTSVIGMAFAQPANDEPCNATPLTLGSICTYTTTTNLSATASAGVPAPICGSYVGSDVWYSIVVPNSGNVYVNSGTGTITNGSMAIYSGTCSSLSLIECDADDSEYGLMPAIYLTGQTPGSTLYIRFWKSGSGTGTFKICALDPPIAPPCNTSPIAGNSCATATPICDLNGYCGNTSGSYTANTWSQLSTVFCGSLENNSFLTFTASATTVSFDVWVNSSTTGYGIQILIFSATNCSGAVTQYGPCYNPAGVAIGPSNIAASGLTIGNTYYIMIDGNGGDVCSYTIGANSGFLTNPVLVDPANLTVCEGDNVDLVASGGDGNYSWTANPQLSATTGANVTATPGPIGTYTYTVSSNTGNPLCPSLSSATSTITVQSCVCDVAGFNNGPICSGQTVNLSATMGPTSTFTWTGPNGFASTNQNPMNVVVPTVPGSYDYTVFSTYNGVNCSSITTVVVNPNPVANVGTYPSVCAQDADLQLVGFPVGGTFSGTGVTGSSFDPSAGSSTISYFVTDANGCTNSHNVLLTVNPNPIPDAGTYTSICVDQAIVPLVGTPVGGVFSGTGVTANNFATNVGTQIITYNYTDANGCSGLDQATITVNPLPNASGGNYVEVCQDAPDVVLAGIPAGGVFSGIGVTGGQFDPSVGTQNINYTFTDANGCSKTSTVLVPVHNSPVINAGDDQTICLGTTFILQGSGGVTYVWDGGIVDGQSITQGLGQVIYTVTGTDAFGCTDNDIIKITVVDMPIASISSDVASGDQPLPVTFYNSSTNATTYTWNFGNGQSTVSGNLGSQSMVYGVDGIYTITLTASNGICNDTDTIYIEVFPLKPPSINIPNVFSPNNDGANEVFFVTGENIVGLELVIFNRWGELMHTISDINEFWAGTTNNGTLANDGVYFYKYKVQGFGTFTLEGQGNITLVR